MKLNYYSFLFLLTLVATGLAGCKDGPGKPKGDYADGVFFVNEGAFLSGNSSISFYDRKKKTVTQGVFEDTNDRPLGDVFQSMTLYGKTAFLVVNNSQKMEIVNAGSMESIATVTGFASPRYALPIDVDRTYVSDWVNNHVAVVDMASNTITDTILTGSGPEQMVMSGNYVFVANSGGFGVDSTITVIDFKTNQVVHTIAAGYGPTAMLVDENGKVWVLCRGDYGDFGNLLDDKAGSLMRINPSTWVVEATFSFGQTEHPTVMVPGVSGSTLYFMNGAVYQMSIGDNALPTQPFINRSFYGLGVDPTDGIIYGADAGNFSSAGKVFRYSSLGGLPVDSLEAGIAPNGFAFQP
ncbi:MAG: hypothetical protein H6581_03310 [Bacteroidia bacterium]|nr:hypothetical protein [Bacteroidia bacterium]